MPYSKPHNRADDRRNRASEETAVLVGDNAVMINFNVEKKTVEITTNAPNLLNRILEEKNVPFTRLTHEDDTVQKIAIPKDAFDKARLAVHQQHSPQTTNLEKAMDSMARIMMIQRDGASR